MNDTDSSFSESTSQNGALQTLRYSTDGCRFRPDTEEVRSSNLLAPTKCSQPRGIASGLFSFVHQILNLRSALGDLLVP